MGRFFIAIALAALAAGGIAGAAAGAPPTYTITQLNPPGANFSDVLDVNTHGQAAGEMRLPSGSSSLFHSFFYDPGMGFTDLTLPGGTTSFALEINSKGVVVGDSLLGGTTGFHAFKFTPGVGMHDLGTGTGTQSFAHDVDQSGNVIGQIFPSGDAFLWRADGTTQDLGHNSMNGFNFVGTVFGYQNSIPGSWSPPYTTFSSFGAVPAPYANGYPVEGNIFGDSVGTATGSGNEAAFFWDGHQYSFKLASGLKFSDGTAVDDASDFLMNAFQDPTSATVPFISFQNGALINGNTLDPSGSPFSTFYEFNSISDLGQIGGAGQSGSQIHGFILSPSAGGQLDVTSAILLNGASSTDTVFIRTMYQDFLKRDQDTKCFEIDRFRGTLDLLPLSGGQVQATSDALQAFLDNVHCAGGGTPSAPVTFPKVFTGTGQREAELVKVGPGTLVIQSTFPLGSAFDIPLSSVRETSGKAPSKLKVTKTKGKTFVRVTVSKLKRGTLHFTVVSKKLLNREPTPITTLTSPR